MKGNGTILLIGGSAALLLYFLSRDNTGTALPPMPVIKLLYRPVPGKITQAFGPRKHPVTGEPDNHNGIDLAAPIGTPVLAPAAGRVKSIYSNTAGGKQLIVEHNGFTTGYAHLSAYSVTVGQTVAAGQVIAKSGNTGNTTGPHLHFTLRDGKGLLTDPAKYLI